MLYFFLSYARGDEDELVHRFYEDLSADVRLLAGKARDDPVGFVDRTIQVGEQWPQRVAEALSTCGSFLALMTPRYFRSEPCGKEWHLFRERALTSTESSLLKPLMWIPTPSTKMHPVAEPIQYHTDALGEPYRRLGVRQLMRLRRYQDDYRSLVFELAKHIVEGVEQQPVPPGTVRSFEEVASAFHDPVPLVDELTLIDERSRPLLVHLVVAASSGPAMRSVRSDLAFYGDRPVEWSPFRPPMPEPLVEYARDIAADHCFETRVADLEELSGGTDLTACDNQIMVLLVDAWITRLDDARQVLWEHDTRTGTTRVPTTAVLIPNSRDDMETRQHWPGLSQACREVLDRLARDHELYRSDITTYRHFELELPGVLEVAKNRLYRRGPARRSPGAAANPEPPRIGGPSADQEGELP